MMQVVYKTYKLSKSVKIILMEISVNYLKKQML